MLTVLIYGQAVKWLMRVFWRCFQVDSVYLFWIRLGGSGRSYFSFIIMKILIFIKSHHSFVDHLSFTIIRIPQFHFTNIIETEENFIFFLFLVFPGSPIYFSDFLVDCSKLLLCPLDGSFIIIHMSYCGNFQKSNHVPRWRGCWLDNGNKYFVLRWDCMVWKRVPIRLDCIGGKVP